MAEPPLRLGSDAAFRRLREHLDDSGYTAEAAAQRLGFARLDHLNQLALCDHALRERNLRLRDPLNVLVRLFVSGQRMDTADVSAWMPVEVLSAFEEVGLIERNGSNLFSPVLLYPAHGLYLVSDRYINPDGAGAPTRSDFVYFALQANTTGFMASLPGSPCGSFLDLCGGCGVAGLWAARNGAAQVWSADVNARAGHFAEFSRRLNGIANARVVTGDLYAAVQDVQDRRFDRIACHPPYAAEIRPGYIYADGGEDGEALLRRVIEGAPGQLAPGGVLTSFQVASDREGEPLEQRLRAWLGPASGEFDVAVVVDEYLAPLSYAAESVVGGDSAANELAQWRALFARHRIERMVFGAVYLRRHPRPGMVPFTARRIRSAETTRAAVEWMLAWESAAAQPDRDAMLLASRPQPSSRAELHVTHQFREGSLQPVSYRFPTQSPFDATLTCRAWMAHLFSRCDGRRTGAELFEESQARLPQGVDRTLFLDGLAALISGGFVEIYPEASPQL